MLKETDVFHLQKSSLIGDCRILPVSVHSEPENNKQKQKEKWPKSISVAGEEGSHLREKAS